MTRLPETPEVTTGFKQAENSRNKEKDPELNEILAEISPAESTNGKISLYIIILIAVLAAVFILSVIGGFILLRSRRRATGTYRYFLTLSGPF